MKIVDCYHSHINVAGGVVSPICVLSLTEENVEKVLYEVRPGLMAVEQVVDTKTGLELTEENVESV